MIESSRDRHPWPWKNLRRPLGTGLAIAVLALLVLVTALRTTPLSGRFREQLTGAGRYDGIYVLDFAGGGYTATANNRLAVRGRYTIKRQTVTFVQSLGPCGLQLGRYDFALSGNRLTFTRVSDACPSRVRELSGTFMKLK